MEAEASHTLEEYLAATSSVVASGRWLERQLEDGERIAIEQALQRLEESVATQEGGAARYETSMFAGEDDEPEAGAPAAEELNEQMLLHALTELQTADVLATLAGRADAAGGPPPAPEASTTRSLDALERTVHSVERYESSAFAGRGELEHFDDPAQAARRLDQRAGEVLDGLVGSAEAAVQDVVGSLKSLDQASVLKAVNDVGGAVMPHLRKAGRLAALAARKLQRGLDVLLKMLPGDIAQSLRERVAGFWNDVLGPQALKAALRHAFDVPEADAHRRRLADRADLRVTAVAGALADLEPLSARFDRTMELVKRVAKTVAVAAAAVVALSAVSATIAAAAPTTGLVAVGAYVLLLAIVIAVGRDYTDSGRSLGRVRGVRSLLADAEAA